MNQFGEKIRELREQNGLLQKHIANKLDIDTPMLSKIERGERKAKRKQIDILAKVLTIDKDELLSLWLADQVYEVVKDENVALKAIQVAEEELKYVKRK
ncbi:MAG: helix-turn-helix transcriptional regulator [Cyclobacteriaceae bacterium]|jgi:transcriptional regulator with XRE-family HTH domain|nr:helix-turn-helix transcriptional regulator [Cytophagales bacterium]MCZ8328644.1 helix-turn-helix transcriptional regulator [Cyclobacteriaceae bacterium]